VIKRRVCEKQTDIQQGKGTMNTYWLTGRDGYTEKLPDYYAEFQNDDDPKPVRLPTTTGKAVDNKVLRPSVESGFNEGDEEELLQDINAESFGHSKPETSDITPVGLVQSM
jgi:hypothetical protein